MKIAPINEQIQVEPGQGPKVVTMRPAWATWFSELYRTINQLLQPSTQAIVTSSRAINGTVYQNTTGRLMRVGITAYGTDGTYLRGYSDAAATPTTIIAYSNQEIVINYYVTLSFYVLSGNYYKVAPNIGSWTLQLWTETVI